MKAKENKGAEGGTIRLTRFCSYKEYEALVSGQVLRNNTDHYHGGKGGSLSSGFCFTPDPPKVAWRYLKGIVDYQICMVLEIDRACLTKSSGKYVDYSASSSASTIPTCIKTEYCTTEYSDRVAKLVEVYDPLEFCSGMPEYEIIALFYDRKVNRPANEMKYRRPYVFKKMPSHADSH